MDQCLCVRLLLLYGMLFSLSHLANSYLSLKNKIKTISSGPVRQK